MSYSSEVFENVPIATEVVTVSAKDIDSGNLKLLPPADSLVYHTLYL